MKSTKVCIAIAAAAALEPAAAKHSGTIANEKEESIGEIIINGQTHHDAGGAHKRRRQEDLYQHNKSVASLLDNEYVEETICGISDDRVASNDVRIGRFWGYPYQGVCTAWLVSEDVFVTAGHCVDEEQQANADRGWIVEFNVPRSEILWQASVFGSRRSIMLNLSLGYIQCLMLNGLVVMTLPCR